MTTEKIDKCLDLLNSITSDDGALDELRAVLKYEREKQTLAEQHKKPKLLNAVKKVIDNKALKKTRPAVAAIQHTADGKQFICDNYIAVLWDTEQPELNCLPQTEQAKSVNVLQIIPTRESCNPFTLTDTNKNVLRNIHKYAKLNKDIEPIICLNDVYYDAKALGKLVDVIGTDFNTIYNKRTLTGGCTISCIYGKDYTALICPVNITRESARELYNDRTEQFKTLISKEN